MVPTDLMAPEGVIEAEMFPDETTIELSDRIQIYLNEAEAKTSVTEAQKAWVNYRAFMAVYLRLSANPSNIDISDQVATAMAVKQSARFYDMAMKQHNLFTSLTVTSSAPKTIPSGPASTRVLM